MRVGHIRSPLLDSLVMLNVFNLIASMQNHKLARRHKSTRPVTNVISILTKIDRFLRNLTERVALGNYYMYIFTINTTCGFIRLLHIYLFHNGVERAPAEELKSENWIFRLGIIAQV